jgi:putative nucleotidyltransferase with HDIG domain
MRLAGRYSVSAMSRPVRPPLSSRVQAYVYVVFALGAAVLAASAVDLASHPLSFHLRWLPLAALTFGSGWLAIKLPGTKASISISETFTFAGTLLFGPAVGSALVALDATVMGLQDSLLRRRLRWQQIIFNIAGPALSIWTAARAAGIDGPLDGPVSLNPDLLITVGIFTALYFLLNSWLVTFVVALEQRVPPFGIWWTNFREVSINFAAGASIAVFLAVNSNGVDLSFIGVILPLMLVVYFTYRWSSRRVEIEQEKVQELNRVFLSTVEALALAIDAKDQVTHGHIRRVQRYTITLAEALGIKDERQLDAIRAAALLHDTGKLAVPEYILNKPGPLTAAEFERMKVHADVGADILKSIDFPYPVEPIVRHHHEQWDGSGYPAGLRGQEIPLGARILSVVDCYDALTSDRPYRPRMTRQQAEQVLTERRGRAYDPWVVDQFVGLLDKLEAMDAADAKGRLAAADGHGREPLPPGRFDVITATTAEEREFNELRRDLPRATDIVAATEVLFKHSKRMVPLVSMALYVPRTESNELVAVASFGVGASAIQGLQVAIGDRISGWAFAHSQVVLNSDATLELGPVARTFSIPLRYAGAFPIIDGKVVAVLMVFANEPFEKDHRRLLENAATLFVSSLSQPLPQGAQAPATPSALFKASIH